MTTKVSLIADNAVTGAAINNLTITANDIADGAVTTAKIADGNVTTSKIADASVTAAKLATGAAIPTGVIVMWSGTIATIPTGWALCNGTNGTPDLRSRFIVGATSDTATGVTFDADTGVVSGSYAPGNTGGEVAHKLTIAEMPEHKHTTSIDGLQVEISGGGAWTMGPGKQTRSSTSFSMNSMGSNDYHENRPPYYALAFIMKVS